METDSLSLPSQFPWPISLPSRSATMRRWWHGASEGPVMVITRPKHPRWWQSLGRNKIWVSGVLRICPSGLGFWLVVVWAIEWGGLEWVLAVCCGFWLCVVGFGCGRDRLASSALSWELFFYILKKPLKWSTGWLWATTLAHLPCPSLESIGERRRTPIGIW